MNNKYLLRIDFIKFIAISLIILLHTSMGMGLSISSSNFFYAWINELSTIVSLFFVISGFLNTYQWINKGPQPYKTFIKRRMIHLLPIYGFVILIAIALYRDFIDSNFLLGVVFFSTNLEKFGTLPVLGPIWMISILVQFYIVFPVLFNKSTKNIIYLINAIIFILIIRYLLLFAYGISEVNLYYSLLGRIDQLMIGMLAAFIFKKIKNRKIYLLTIPTSLILLSYIFMKKPTFVNYTEPNLIFAYLPTLESIIWAAFLIGLLNLPTIQIKSKILKNIGRIVLPMMATHIIVVDAFFRHFYDLRIVSNEVNNLILITLLIILPLTIVLSIYTYFIVKIPFENRDQT